MYVRNTQRVALLTMHVHEIIYVDEICTYTINIMYVHSICTQFLWTYTEVILYVHDSYRVRARYQREYFYQRNLSIYIFI